MQPQLLINLSKIKVLCVFGLFTAQSKVSALDKLVENINEMTLELQNIVLLYAICVLFRRI